MEGLLGLLFVSRLNPDATAEVTHLAIIGLEEISAAAKSTWHVMARFPKLSMYGCVVAWRYKSVWLACA